MYSVRGRTDGISLTLVLWNGHATQRIQVVGVEIFAVEIPDLGAHMVWQRASARGTPGSTVTPGIQNHHRRGIAPPSGVVLDLDSTGVTTDGVEGAGRVFENREGGGIVFSLGVMIPPSAGIAFTLSGIERQMEVMALWMEDEADSVEAWDAHPASYWFA